MGFSPYSNEICQFNIPPTVFSEQTAKYTMFTNNSAYTVIEFLLAQLNSTCPHRPVTIDINKFNNFSNSAILYLCNASKSLN